MDHIIFIDAFVQNLKRLDFVIKSLVVVVNRVVYELRGRLRYFILWSLYQTVVLGVVKRRLLESGHFVLLLHCLKVGLDL